MAHDTGCRSSELLKLKIKDVIFKYARDRQYAEVSVNGKTGTRHLPLIDSIPYIKDYLQDEHPQAGNSNALLFSAEAGKNFDKGRPSEHLPLLISTRKSTGYLSKTTKARDY